MLNDNIVSFILGIVLKGYDDIIDNNIKVSDTIIEFLKSLIVCLFVLLSYNDFSFSISIVITLILSYTVGGVDLPFWKSLLGIAIITSFISFKLEDNIFQRFILILLLPIGIILDPLLFPEEKSTQKTLFRLIFLICTAIFLYFIDNLSGFDFFNFPFYKNICYFIIGYLFISIVNGFLNINDNKVSKSDNQEIHITSEKDNNKKI